MPPQPGSFASLVSKLLRGADGSTGRLTGYRFAPVGQILIRQPTVDIAQFGIS
jgi:hypothetical protein